MSRETENEPMATVERILVAVDTSRQSHRALEAAAELASVLDAELYGLFVEDDNLLRLCDLPFLREIGSFSAASRPLDGRAVQRELAQQAAGIRRTIAQTAINANVRWSFQVTRGEVVEELLVAAESAGLVTLGRVGRSLGKRYGSTAQSVVRRSMRPVFLLGDGGLRYPLTVLYTGSPASARALRLAVLLLQDRETELRILFLATSGLAEDERTRVVADIRALGIAVQVQTLDAQEHLSSVVRTGEPGTLVLPGDQAALLDKVARTAIVVP